MLDDPTDHRPNPGAMSVSSQRDEKGIYHAVLTVSDDEVIPLSGTIAQRWAAHVLAAVAVADYEECILTQLTAFGIDALEVAAIVKTMRATFSLPAPALGSLTVEPAVAYISGKAFLKIHRHGKPFAQWETADAAAHAAHTLQAVNMAVMDTLYYEALLAFGLDEANASRAVHHVQDAQTA